MPWGDMNECNVSERHQAARPKECGEKVGWRRKEGNEVGRSGPQEGGVRQKRASSEVRVEEKKRPGRRGGGLH